MSRIIAAVVLVFLLIGLCITDRLVVNSICDKIYKGIENCEIASQTAVADAVLEIKNNWEDSEGTLSLFINHDILDEISTSISMLDAYRYERDEDFLSECMVIKMKLEYIKKGSGFNMRRVF